MMKYGPYHGVARRVHRDNPLFPDGVQCVHLEDERDLLVPPIEYAIKPGDALVVETAPGEVDESMEIWRIQINDKPLFPRPLWDIYYEDHPRYWAGERIENGQIVDHRGQPRWKAGADE